MRSGSTSQRHREQREEESEKVTENTRDREQGLLLVLVHRSGQLRIEKELLDNERGTKNQQNSNQATENATEPRNTRTRHREESTEMNRDRGRQPVMAHGSNGDWWRGGGGEGAKQNDDNEPDKMTRSRHRETTPVASGEAKNSDGGGLTGARQFW